MSKSCVCVCVCVCERERERERERESAQAQMQTWVRNTEEGGPLIHLSKGNGIEQTELFLKVSQHGDLFDAWILGSLKSVPQSYFLNIEFLKVFVLNTFSSQVS
jgi:hypothetical protein